MKSFMLLVTLALFSSVSIGGEMFEKDWDLHIKFGGWSHHGESKEFGKYDFNETHNGFGIQVWKGFKQYPWHLGAEVFFMRDSFDRAAKMVSASAKYEWAFNNDIFTGLDLITGLTYHDRSFIHHFFYRHNNEMIVTHSDIYRNEIITPSLMLTARFFDKFEVDFTHYPEMGFNRYSVTFLRFGIKI